MTGNSQRQYTKSIPSLTNPMPNASYDEMTTSVDVGRTVDVIYLDCGKALRRSPTAFLYPCWDVTV